MPAADCRPVVGHERAGGRPRALEQRSGRLPERDPEDFRVDANARVRREDSDLVWSRARPTRARPSKRGSRGKRSSSTLPSLVMAAEPSWAHLAPVERRNDVSEMVRRLQSAEERPTSHTRSRGRARGSQRATNVRLPSDPSCPSRRPDERLPGAPRKFRRARRRRRRARGRARNDFGWLVVPSSRPLRAKPQLDGSRVKSGGSTWRCGWGDSVVLAVVTTEV